MVIMGGDADVLAARDLLPALVVVQVMARAFIHGNAVLMGVAHGVVDSVDVVVAAVVAPVAASWPGKRRTGHYEPYREQGKEPIDEVCSSGIAHGSTWTCSQPESAVTMSSDPT